MDDTAERDWREKVCYCFARVVTIHGCLIEHTVMQNLAVLDHTTIKYHGTISVLLIFLYKQISLYRRCANFNIVYTLLRSTNNLIYLEGSAYIIIILG